MTEPDTETESADSRPHQVPDVLLTRSGVCRQTHSGGEKELTAFEPRTGVGEFAHRNPTHLAGQVAGTRDGHKPEIAHAQHFTDSQGHLHSLNISDTGDRPILQDGPPAGKAAA